MGRAPEFNGVTPQRSRKRKRKALANELDLRLAFRRITLTSKVAIQTMNRGGLDPERLSRELESLRKGRFMDLLFEKNGLDPERLSRELERLRKDRYMDSLFANSQSPLEEEYPMQPNVSASPTTTRWSSQGLAEELLLLGLPRFATVEAAQRAREMPILSWVKNRQREEILPC
jgi:hypothetical protein